MFTIYQVWWESDMTEGRRPKRYVTSFMVEEDAWSYANSKSGLMGRKCEDWRTYSGGQDWDVRQVNVYETLDESSEATKEDIKKKALAKLTTIEKAILGL